MSRRQKMIGNLFRAFADVLNANSLAYKLRQKRIALFRSLITYLPKPIRILDVGGTTKFWEKMGIECNGTIELVILNLTLEDVETYHPNIVGFVGDARNMSEFGKGEFDIVFSNSVIEHVGGYEDQKGMAKEIQRVGKRFFLQTPNYYFPIEPHFLFPFFQYLPLWLEVFLLTHFNLGWYKRITDKKQAKRVVRSIRLVKRTELKALFPKCTIHEEKIFGLTYSFIVENIRASIQ